MQCNEMHYISRDMYWHSWVCIGIHGHVLATPTWMHLYVSDMGMYWCVLVRTGIKWCVLAWIGMCWSALALSCAVLA